MPGLLTADIMVNQKENQQLESTQMLMNEQKINEKM